MKALYGRASFVLLFLFMVQDARAGRVRTLYTNDQLMQPVSLAMGRSTVLRFDDKPKTVVIGNQNYFGIEYIGNDVTIQPQGVVTTNVFVYTEYQTYGLILKVGNDSSYDDLVYVKWRPGYVSVPERKLKQGVELVAEKAIGKKGEIKDLVHVNVSRAIQTLAQGLMILDLELENLSKNRLKTSEIELKLVDPKKDLSFQKVTFRSDELLPDEKTQARVLVRASSFEGTSLEVKIQGKALKIDLSVKNRSKLR